MYSVVLAAMLTTAPTTPQWGWHHGCWSCHGCYGCYGCYGGWAWGWPGYYGWGWPGYYGYGYGYGYGCGGAFGCAGGGYACVGCYGSYGWATYYTAAAPVLPPIQLAETPRKNSAAEATVVVQAPDQTKIFVEGKQVTLRPDGSFTTPRLQPGETYVYRIRAETIRGGQPISLSKNVRVRAGRTSQVAFDAPPPPDDAKPAPARITVYLPNDAKLYVNGELCPLRSASRSFDTPRLDPRRDYAYTLKAEVVRDGRTRIEKKTVPFRGGQPVTVDFRDLDAVRTAGR